MEILSFVISSKVNTCLEQVTTEKEVVDSVKSVVPSGSGISFDVTLTKGLKKLWGFCVAAAPKAAHSGGPSNVVQVASVDDDSPLPEGVPEAIGKAWVSKHGFHLSGARLLVGSD